MKNGKSNQHKNQINSDTVTHVDSVKTSQSNNIKQNSVNGYKENGKAIRNKSHEDEDQILDNVGLNHSRHKLVPDGNDFKLVFISSDSSKESDNLNSSLEGANSPEALNQTADTPNKTEIQQGYLSDSQRNKISKSSSKTYSKGGFDCIATSSPKEGRSSSSKTPPRLPLKSNLRRTHSKAEGSSNSSGASSMEMDPSKISENGSTPNKVGAPQFMLDHDFHHYDTGLIGAGSCSSPSINTIRTAATRDIDSPVGASYSK